MPMTISCVAWREFTIGHERPMRRRSPALPAPSRSTPILPRLTAWRHAVSHSAKPSGWVEDPQREIAEATGLARRAAELGADDAIALCGAAMVLSYVIGDLDTASTLIARGPDARSELCLGLARQRLDQGLVGRARDRDRARRTCDAAEPHRSAHLHHANVTACAHFLAGRFDDALAWAQEVAWERPGFLIATMVVAAAAALADRPVDAGRAMTQLRETAPVIRLGNLRDYWPIRRPEDFARWHEGLRRAGLPP